MKKILAIGASNSSKSINKSFATYVANQVKDSEVIAADLNNLELPLYGTDLEASSGIPENATTFNQMLEEADGIVMSLAEHNGNVTTAFKNLWDWTSRIDQKVWKNKPMLLLATSPGGRGAQSVLAIVKGLMPHYGGNVVSDFSLPFFHENFSSEGIQDEELNEQLNQKIQLFEESL